MVSGSEYARLQCPRTMAPITEASAKAVAHQTFRVPRWCCMTRSITTGVATHLALIAVWSSGERPTSPTVAGKAGGHQKTSKQLCRWFEVISLFLVSELYVFHVPIGFSEPNSAVGSFLELPV